MALQMVAGNTVNGHGVRVEALIQGLQFDVEKIFPLDLPFPFALHHGDGTDGDQIEGGRNRPRCFHVETDVDRIRHPGRTP